MKKIRKKALAWVFLPTNKHLIEICECEIFPINNKTIIEFGSRMQDMKNHYNLGLHLFDNINLRLNNTLYAVRPHLILV